MDNNILNTLTIVGISLFSLIILLLLFRSVLLWFWKINKQVELSEKNNFILNEILIELKNRQNKTL